MTLDDLIADAVKRMEENLSDADAEFMRLCGKALAEIGVKSAAEADSHFARYGWTDGSLEGAGAIRRMLNNVKKANNREMNGLLRDVQAAVYDEAKTLKAERGQSLLPFDEFSSYVKANPALKEVREKHAAMGNSTAVGALYRRTIGNALAEMTGDEGRLNYPHAVRKAIRSLSEQGVSVIAYASGYKRRLDSSARADLMDEFTEITQGMERRAAEVIGTDGWEISAHDHCAEDHEDVQGRVFTNEEFDKLQSGAVAVDTEGDARQLRRPIGKWNCHHIAYPIVIGVSERAYSPERLEEIKRKNESGVEFRGKRMTLYEATQRQRRLETLMRRERGKLACVKEVAGADPAFAKDLRDGEARLKGLREAYKELGAALEPSAIRAKWERSYNVGAGRKGGAAPSGKAPRGQPGLFDSPLAAQPGRGERDVPSKSVVRKESYSRLEPAEAERREYPYLREKTRESGLSGAPHEFMTIIDRGTMRPATFEGHEDGVNDNDAMTKLFETSKPKSLTILHSHTKEAGLSGKDFALACQYPSIAKVGQITPKGSIEETWVVKAGRKITDAEINKLAKEILDELLALRKKGVYNGTNWELIQARNAKLKARMKELYGWILR